MPHRCENEGKMKIQQGDLILDIRATGGHVRINNLIVLVMVSVVKPEKILRRSLEVGMALVLFLTSCGAL